MYFTLTKKRLFIILCVAVAVLLLLAQFFSARASAIILDTNASRTAFIEGLGVELLSDEYTSKKVVIPEEFNEVYKNYNKLQKEANFNLYDFRGKEVTVYTYFCVGERVVNLMVYKNRLIGGDVAETKLGGGMKALN